MHASGTPVELYTPLPSEDDLLFSRNKKKLAEVLGRVCLFYNALYLCLVVFFVLDYARSKKVISTSTWQRTSLPFFVRLQHCVAKTIFLC